MIVVALLSLPFLYVFARRPVLRRLALRNAVRRPRETLLVVLGSLLGTAIMTGSFVIGDTFDASVRRGAYEQLGPVDEVVSSNGFAAGAPGSGRVRRFPRRRRRRRAATHPHESSDRNRQLRGAEGAAARDRLRRGPALRR